MQSIEARLAALRHRHVGKEREIEAEQRRPVPDLTQLQELKRQKLRLKDEMARFEGLLRTLDRGPIAAKAGGGEPA